MTPAEALMDALERANGRTLVMRVGARPHVITDSAAVRDIGSTEITTPAVQALFTELVPEDVRLTLHRERRVVVPLTAAGRPDHLLTVDYADSRYSLRLERAVPLEQEAQLEQEAPELPQPAPLPAPHVAPPGDLQSAVPRDLGAGQQALAEDAISHSFMVDPASRSTLAALQLVKTYFTGPQDIALADANHLSERMWGLAGGTTPLLYRIRWTRALRPARYALSWLKKRGVARLAVGGLRPVCRAADAVVTSLPSSPFRQTRPSLAGEELDSRTLAECLSEFTRSRSLRPEYDERSAAWLLGMLGRKTHLGTLRKVLVREAKGRVAGWYLYYLKRGDIAEVVQAGGRDDSISRVFDHLFYDAWQSGAVAVSGQVDPAYMQALSDAHCIFRLDRHSGGVRLHSRRPEVLQTILRGDAFLTRLEGEWWIPFE